MKKILLLFCTLLLANGFIYAQQKLQVFVSAAAPTKVKIEWQNPHGDSVVQLNVQRSWDSAKNFRTVFAPLSPELPQNGYIDETAGYTGMYYRVFYVLSN